ncbi:MAG TPA: hypothetical protein GX707_15735, partial [Epulopiscium sp.]|nr:hypothetical protein [Candidatus Epulonipiscium sp.]
DIGRYINDYRPAKGENRIVIWFKNGTEVYVRWVEEIKEFVFSEVE